MLRFASSGPRTRSLPISVPSSRSKSLFINKRFYVSIGPFSKPFASFKMRLIERMLS
jgi:hypothetical protein